MLDLGWPGKEGVEFKLLRPFLRQGLPNEPGALIFPGGS
jgi:hypothetical protein